jgi:Arc/MetJ-type ribon-helix-helix transcriptional regulator
MTVGERITIRISEEQLRLVQDMIDSGRSESISDVIRAAL